MLFSNKGINGGLDDLKQDLLRVAAWCCEKCLLIDPEKTKFCVFGSSKLLCQTSIPLITFLGKKLPVVHSVKDRGVIVDKNLSFDEDINVLASDLMNKLVMLCRIRHLFDQQSLFIIINSLIFTKLFYCSTVWSGTSKTNIHKLQLVQNFSARILSGKRKFEHITPTLKDLNLLPVSDLLLIRDAVLMYKCMDNLAPDYLTCLLKKRSSIHQHNTRNSKNIDIPKCRTAKAQNSPFFFLQRSFYLEFRFLVQS